MSDWQWVRCGNVPAFLPIKGSDEAPIPLSPNDLQADPSGCKYIKLCPRSIALTKFLTDSGRGRKAPTGRNYIRIYVRTYV